MITQGFVFSMPQALPGLKPSRAQLCEQKEDDLNLNLKSHEYPQIPLRAKRLSALSELWMLESEHTESSLKYQKTSYHDVPFMAWLASSGNVNCPFSSWGQSLSACGHLPGRSDPDH